MFCTKAGEVPGESSPLISCSCWLFGNRAVAVALSDLCSAFACSSLPSASVVLVSCLISHTVNIRAEKCVLGRRGQTVGFQLPVLDYQLYKFPSHIYCSVTKPLQFMPSEVLTQQRRLPRDSNLIF